MKIKIILISLLLLNPMSCFAEQDFSSYKKLNQYTLNMINVIHDYQKGSSEKEIMSGLQHKPLETKKEAISLYSFLSNQGIEEAYFKIFSDYIIFVNQYLDPLNENQSHDGKCGWALMSRFATIKRIRDGLTIEQIKSMSYPGFESEIDSLFYVATHASIRRVLDMTAQSFSNCALNNQE